MTQEQEVTQSSTPEKAKKSKRFQGLCDWKKQTFDFSSLCVWNNCPRKFYWTYVRGFRWHSLAADFGSAFHKALELKEFGQPVGEALEYLPPEEVGSYSRERLTTLLEAYKEKYKDDGLIVRRNETEFILDLPNGCWYSGKIDKVVEKGGRIGIFDTKTSKSVGKYFFEKYAYPHMQMDGYAWATRRLVGSCDFVLIDGISTAECPRSERFQRAEFYRTEAQLNEFEETVCAVTNEALSILDMAEGHSSDISKKFFLMRTTWCEQYGGCPYRDLCAYGEDEVTISRFNKVEEENHDAE